MYNCILLYGDHYYPLLKSAGPFRIATELRKNNFSVLCIDLSAFSNDFDFKLKPFLKRAIGSNTLWVGISGTFLFNIFGLPYEFIQEKTSEINSDPKLSMGIQNFVSYVHSINPQVKFIVGGSRSWNLSQFGFKHFDGYPDQKIVDYTRWLQGTLDKTPFEFYNTRIYNKEWEDFSSSQILYTQDDIVLPNESLTTEVARGCIFKCKFCSYSLNGKTKGEWIKQADVLKEEFVKNFELHGITKYQFSDDTFNDSADKIKFLYDQVFSKLPFSIQFISYLRLDLLLRFPDTVEILKNSGLKSALFGIESLNWQSAKSIGKGVDPFELLAFLKQVKQTTWQDVHTYSGFIFGLPHDTRETFEEFDEFMSSEKNPLDTWVVQPLEIIPANLGAFKFEFSFLDKEYSKYGYVVKKNTNNGYNEARFTWENHKIGLDYSYCKQKSDDLMNKYLTSHPRFKSQGGWLYFYFNRWIPSEDLANLSHRKLCEKYQTQDFSKVTAPIKELLEKEKSYYRTALYQRLVEKQTSGIIK